MELKKRQVALNLQPVQLLSSPYLRCLQTASPTADLLDLNISLENGLAECHFAQNYVATAEERWAYFPRVDLQYMSLFEPVANDDANPPFKSTTGIVACESFPRGYMERMIAFSCVLTQSLTHLMSPGEMCVAFSHAASVALVAALTNSTTVVWTMAPTGIFHLILTPGETTWTLVDQETSGQNAHCQQTSPGTFAWGFERVEGAFGVWSELLSEKRKGKRKEEENGTASKRTKMADSTTHDTSSGRRDCGGGDSPW